MINQKLKKIKLHSYHIILVLFVGLLVGPILIGTLIQQNQLIKAFDAFFYVLISEMPRYQFLEILIWPINYNFLPGFLPSFFYPLVLTGLILVIIFKRSLVWYYVFCILIGSVLAYYITALDYHFIFRERPFTTLPNNVDDFWKNIWKNFSSFPSGHTRETTMYSAIIASYLPKLKWPLLVLTLFVGFSRIYVGAHYPTDVLAGLAIGFLTAKVVLMISRDIQIILENRKGIPHGQKPKASLTD